MGWARMGRAGRSCEWAWKQSLLWTEKLELGTETKIVFWLVPLSRKEMQIRTEETGSLDKTLLLSNLDSVYSFAKLE